MRAGESSLQKLSKTLHRGTNFIEEFPAFYGNGSFIYTVQHISLKVNLMCLTQKIRAPGNSPGKKEKAKSQLRRQQSSRMWRLEMVFKYCRLDELITTRWDGWRYEKLEKNLQNQPTATPER